MKEHPASRSALTKTGVALSALALALNLSACSGTAENRPEPVDYDGVVLITNSHANVPAPSLSEQSENIVKGALEHSLPISVIAVDGTPKVADLGLLKPTGNNSTTRRRSINKLFKTIKEGLAIPPDSDGANSYDAFGLAISEAGGRGMKSPIIICLECGLDSTGPLDMTRENALLGAPQSYVDYLTSSKQLVKLPETMSRVRVHLVSPGATAAPQEPLSGYHQRLLGDIWKAAFEASGAEVIVDGPQPGGDPITTEFTVPVVTPPAPPKMTPIAACDPEPQKFDETTGVRFRPNEDVWVDEQLAREALAKAAAWLMADGGRKATISGTTVAMNTGDPDEGKELSLARAEKAADLLVALGVSPSQIVGVEGLGPHFPGRVEDRTPEGVFDPIKASQNRRIIVQLTSTC